MNHNQRESILYRQTKAGHTFVTMSSENPGPGMSGSAMAASDPMIGQIIDKRYRITAKLGEGGMGEVYAADHLRINRRLAIKLLRAEVLTNEEAVLRFEQEAMTASSIGHENIIRIEDSGKLDDGRIYLAMELLEGQPFNDLIEGKIIGHDRLLNILIQTCHGLEAAHKKGIIHRDMKPENIYITTSRAGTDLPKLLDFGIAKVSQAEGENHLTRTGTIFGTPFYMAPEQALGQAVDRRVDVYAMGVIMYEVFCGVVPFGGESFMGILTQHITAEPVPPTITAQQQGRILPPGVEAIIVKAMKKEPNERFQNMAELVHALIPIYRSMAGAGMSSYMASQPTMAHPPQQGYHPQTGQAPTQQRPPTTGSPYDPMTRPGSISGSAPAAMPGYAQMAGASDSLQIPARKSRAGLYLFLFLLLAGGGAATAYVMLGIGESESVASSETTTPKADPAGKVPTTPEKIVPAVKEDPQKTEPTEDLRAKTILDAGTDEVVPATIQIDAAVPKTPVIIPVLIASEPSGAKIYIKGKNTGKKTPAILKVDPDSPTSLILKLRKHKDLQVEVDGKQEKLIVSLVSKVRKPNRTNRPDKTPAPKPEPSNVPPDTKPKPDKIPDPKPEPVDPCKKNPNLPRCMLE